VLLGALFLFPAGDAGGVGIISSTIGSFSASSLLTSCFVKNGIVVVMLSWGSIVTIVPSCCLDSL